MLMIRESLIQLFLLDNYLLKIKTCKGEHLRRMWSLPSRDLQLAI